MVLLDSFFIQQRHQIADLAAKTRLPAAYGASEHVDAGGLMSHGQNVAESYRRAATYVDKIFKGAKPGDSPIEQPTKLELTINLKAARALGIYLPRELVAVADRGIQ